MGLAGSLNRLGTAAPAALLATALACVPKAEAQDARASPPVAAVASPSPADDSQIGDVIVTANKRSELLKDVPTSISVLDGSQLLLDHIQDYEDLTRFVPGISFATQGQPGTSNIEIRGVSSTVGSQTVGVYLDDVPLLITNNYEGATEPKFLDFDRIEVLRGPQGTLYGAGSEGGTIRFVSNLPQLDKYEASVRTDLSGTDFGGVNYDERGTVNIPVVPGTFAIRASVEYGEQSGWVNNYDPQGIRDRNDINDERDFVGRVAGRYVSDGGLSVVASVFAQNVKSADSPDFYPDLGLYKIQKGVIEFDRDIIVVPSVTVTQDLGFADLTSVSSYFWRETNRQKDGTAFNSAPLAQELDGFFPAQTALNNSLIGALPSPVSFHDEWETPTEEIRLASKSQDETGLPFRYTVGLYYSDQKNQHRDYEPIPGLSAAYQTIYGQNINFGPLGNNTPNLFSRDLVYYVTDHNDTAQYAGFGQLDVDILPQLHFGAGARYLIAREAFSEVGAGVFELGNAGVGGPAYTQTADFHAFTPKFTLDYDLTPATNLYASAAKGFRLGGATSPNFNTFCLAGLQQLGVSSPPSSYAPDHLWTYEGGVKTTLLDRTLSINADGYDIQWSNIQQSLIIPICGGELNVNVGNAQSYGGELTVAYKPPFARGLTLGLTGGIEHSVITSSNNQITAQPGDSVLNTPNWTITPSIDYTREIAEDVIGFVRASFAWTGTTHSSFLVTDPNYRNPGYGVLNATMGATFGRFEATLYARNLLDDRTIYQRPQINTVTEAYTVQPLTIGVTLSAKF